MDILRQDTRYNAVFDKSVVIRPEKYQWLPSPMPGVARMMLDHVGGEVACATSIVRYQPNSAFSSHSHDGGEEYLVLKGTEGATIFVKLHQFAE